jgi:hypothetical protein
MSNEKDRNQEQQESEHPGITNQAVGVTTGLRQRLQQGRIRRFGMPLRRMRAPDSMLRHSALGHLPPCALKTAFPIKREKKRRTGVG